MKKAMMLTTTAYMSERFNRSNIETLERMGYEVHVVANFDKGNPTTNEVLEDFKRWIEWHHGKWFSIAITKHPADFKDNGKAYRQILKLIRLHRYEFIHCHTPVGGVLGRVAAHQTGTKIIYTAHGFHFFQGAPLKNWLLYYPVERFLSRWTDMLICINHEDYDRAQRSFHAKRTVYVPGVGIETEKFHSDSINNDEKRKELGLKADDRMFLSVGELSERKNHEIVIRALSKLEDKNYKFFIVGMGKLNDYLAETIKNLNLSEHVFLLGYRTDISELCQAADLFIFPSYQEGLPVALMEAMASGLPCIASNIRGNVELIEDGKGGYLCEPRDANEFAEKINALSNCEELRSRMGAYNREKIRGFDEEIINQRMKELYRTI